MQVMIATDIFGINNDVNQLVKRLESDEVKVRVIDPYEGEKIDFQTDEEAYAFFLKHCGIDRYITLIQKELSSVVTPCVVIGFSVGAASAWKATDGLDLSKHLHLICFYPSQIRHYLEVNPTCYVTVVFPESEPSFDIDNVMHQLNRQKMVSCFKSQFKHGFMNQNSRNHTIQGATLFNDYISKKEIIFDVKTLQCQFSSISEEA